MEAEVLTDDVSDTSPASRFVTAVSETEAYTMSQESWTSLNVNSNILGDFEESDFNKDLSDYSLPVKRSSKRSKHPETQRKRRNADESSDTGHSHGLAVKSGSESSSATNVAIEQSEKWSWVNGKF